MLCINVSTSSKYPKRNWELVLLRLLDLSSLLVQVSKKELRDELFTSIIGHLSSKYPKRNWEINIPHTNISTSNPWQVSKKELRDYYRLHAERQDHHGAKYPKRNWEISWLERCVTVIPLAKYPKRNWETVTWAVRVSWRVPSIQKGIESNTTY